MIDRRYILLLTVLLAIGLVVICTFRCPAMPTEETSGLRVLPPAGTSRSSAVAVGTDNDVTIAQTRRAVKRGTSAVEI